MHTTRTLLTAAIAAAISVALALASTTASALRLAPEFDVNLDAAPEHRWDGAVNKILALHPWEYSIGALVDGFNNSVYVHLSAAQKQAVEGVVATRFPTVYKELSGLQRQYVAAGHPEVTLSFLAMATWWHELDHAGDLRGDLRGDSKIKMTKRECTGVLVLPQDPASDTIHGRNLDQDQSIAAARNATMTIRFRRAGASSQQQQQQPLYVGYGQYWSLTAGVVTASQVGGVTLEENWRFSHGALSLREIVERIQQPSTMPQVQMFRILLERNRNNAPTDFDAAVSFLLTQSTFAAPFYTILSGTKRRGGILSIDAFNASNSFAELLGAANSSRHCCPTPWVCVQTNYEPNQKDSARDPRRTVALDTIRDLGWANAGTDLGVWQTLSVYPVHNEGTFYSTVMSVSPMQAPKSFIRRAMRPA